MKLSFSINKKKTLLLIIYVTLLVSCNKKDTLFVSLDKSETNINFQNKLHHTAELNILNYLYYYNGSGISAGDFNNYGLIFFCVAFLISEFLIFFIALKIGLIKFIKIKLDFDFNFTKNMLRKALIEDNGDDNTI